MNDAKTPPESSSKVGGPIDKVKVALRFFADDLDPHDVTRLLGCDPTNAHAKGEMVITPSGKGGRPALTGSWHLRSDENESASLEIHITGLLRRVSDDLAVWSRLTANYKSDLFCGLFLADWNRGLTLSEGVLRMVAERGLSINFDIYANLEGGDDGGVS